MLIEALRAPAAGWAWLAFSVLLLLRLVLWSAWRKRLQTAAAAMESLGAIDAAGRHLQASSFAALAAALVVLASPLGDAGQQGLQAAAGVLALAGGLWFKFTLVTRAAYTQGFTLPHLPVRGVARRKEG